MQLGAQEVQGGYLACGAVMLWTSDGKGYFRDELLVIVELEREDAIHGAC